MIYLVTGVPGAGKTLYALTWLKQFAEKEKRDVFFSGIKDCALPWTNVDGGVTLADGAKVNGAEDWHKLPAKSIIVIDECQRIFRPRAHGVAVPQCVSELETHRHRGVDLLLITQHPMLIDSNVRRLVGLHWHVVRKFGMHRATVHEWTSVKEQADKNRVDSVRHEFKYPAEAFSWYKSAEVHTHKRRIPMRLFFFLLIPFLIAGAGFGLYSRLWKYATPEGAAGRISAGVKPVGGVGGGLVQTSNGGKPVKSFAEQQRDYIDSFTPLVAGMVYTAPAYVEVTKPVRAPAPVACVMSELKGCRCYSQQGTLLASVPALMCEQLVAHGFFQHWDDHNAATSAEKKPVKVEGAQKPTDARETVLVPSSAVDGGRVVKSEVRQASTSSTGSR